MILIELIRRKFRILNKFFSETDRKKRNYGKRRLLHS